MTPGYSSGVTADGPTPGGPPPGDLKDIGARLGRGFGGGSAMKSSMSSAPRSRAMPSPSYESGSVGMGMAMASAAPMDMAMESRLAMLDAGLERGEMMAPMMSKSSMLEEAMDREFASYAIKGTNAAVKNYRAKKKK